jgi:hypothetical protein
MKKLQYECLYVTKTKKKLHVILFLLLLYRYIIGAGHEIQLLAYIQCTWLRPHNIQSTHP